MRNFFMLDDAAVGPNCFLLMRHKAAGYLRNRFMRMMISIATASKTPVADKTSKAGSSDAAMASMMPRSRSLVISSASPWHNRTKGGVVCGAGFVLTSASIGPVS